MAKNNRYSRRRDHPMRVIEDHLRRKSDKQLDTRFPSPLNNITSPHRAEGFNKTPSTTVVSTPLNNMANIMQTGFTFQAFTSLWTFQAGVGPDEGNVVRIDGDLHGLHKVNSANMTVHDNGTFSVMVKGFNSGVASPTDEYVLSIHQFNTDTTPLDEESLVVVWDKSEDELRLYPDITNYPTTYVVVSVAEADWQAEEWNLIRITWSYSTQSWTLSWNEMEGDLVTPATPDVIPWGEWNEFTEIEVFTDLAGLNDIYHDCAFLLFGQGEDPTFHKRTEWGQNGFIPSTSGTAVAALTTIIEWSDAAPDRTFTITPTGSSYSYYINGIRYIKTIAESIQLANTDGYWVIFFVGETLTSAHNPSIDQIKTIIETNCWVTGIYWNSDLVEGQMFNERHGKVMDPKTHRVLHETFGMLWSNGMALGNILTEQTGHVDTHAQFSNTEGEAYDEDLEQGIQALISTVGLQIWYNDNGLWYWDTNAGFSVIDDGVGARLAYNNVAAGPLVEVDNAKFVLCHVFASNHTGGKLIAIVGQAQYANKTAAQAGAETEIQNLVTGDLPTPEFVPIATVIFQTATGYLNAVKARIRETADGADYIDWRAGKRIGGGAISTNPGGADKSVQYNSAGIFQGDEGNFEYDDATGILTVPNVDVTGTAGLGNAVPDANIGVSFDKTYVDTDNTSKIGTENTLTVSKTAAVMTARATGFETSITLDAGNTRNWTSSINGFRVNVDTENGSAGAVAAVNGLQVNTSLDAAGALVGELRGIQIKGLSGGLRAGASYGIKIEPQGAGVLSYGLFIDNIGAGASWAIKTAVGLVDFGDDVQCGNDLLVTNDLTVNGDQSLIGDLRGGVTYSTFYSNPAAANFVGFFGLKLLQNETTLPVGFTSRIDYPRTVQITVTGDGSTDATITINGINTDGAALIETLNFVDVFISATQNTIKAFAQVTSIVVTGVGGGGGTYQAGWTAILGYANYPFQATTDVFKVTAGGAYVDPTALTIVALYGTIDLSAYVDGSTSINVWYRPWK